MLLCPLGVAGGVESAKSDGDWVKNMPKAPKTAFAIAYGCWGWVALVRQVSDALYDRLEIIENFKRWSIATSEFKRGWDLVQEARVATSEPGEVKMRIAAAEERGVDYHVAGSQNGYRPPMARCFGAVRVSPIDPSRTAFTHAVRQAGMTDFTFHDLRHTFASRLVMSGVDLPTVQALMGHKDISMTLRYTHLSSDHKQRAVLCPGVLCGRVPTIFPTGEREGDSDVA